MKNTWTLTTCLVLINDFYNDWKQYHFCCRNCLNSVKVFYGEKNLNVNDFWSLISRKQSRGQRFAFTLKFKSQRQEKDLKLSSNQMTEASMKPCNGDGQYPGDSFK